MLFPLPWSSKFGLNYINLQCQKLVQSNTWGSQHGKRGLNVLFWNTPFPNGSFRNRGYSQLWTLCVDDAIRIQIRTYLIYIVHFMYRLVLKGSDKFWYVQTCFDVSLWDPFQTSFDIARQGLSWCQVKFWNFKTSFDMFRQVLICSD